MGRKHRRLTRYNGKPVDPQQYLPALARAGTVAPGHARRLYAAMRSHRS
jgi:hypothetical protein